jgi:tetratricopeptide (TPR) repeat protein
VGPLLATRGLRVTAGVVFVLLGAIGFLPLFGGPGYEHSLASGLVVPSAAAVLVALQVSSAVDAPPGPWVSRGIATGLVLAGVAFATALLHGVRVGFCDVAGGATLFALTAGVGGAAGGVWGALVGAAVRGWRGRRLACVLLAIAAPIAGIAGSVARFYGSPMVFAYDPFFGYFSGTLYDTVVDVRPELWTYRGGSIAGMGGLCLLSSSLERVAAGRLALRPDRRLATIAGVALLVAALVVVARGPALGHWQTSSTIAATLGAQRSGPRCDVFYPDTVLAPQAELMVRDCEEQLAEDERRLGARLEGRLSVFAFADGGEKRRLMGAAETSIAKPWRHEVYVQVSAYPHPVLGHEIAHVLAGSFAPGPFRVAGGLVPDPGLIEGLAEATSPDDDELTEAQWARAMLDLGILPPMRSIFSLGFLGDSAERSYTVAGAFVGWVMDTRGPATVRAWYGGGSIEALTQRSWLALEEDFAGWLRTLPMPAEASAYARARFEKQSVWARRCPHVVDALGRAADRCRDEHRFEKAASLYTQALARDPTDWRARLDHARVLRAMDQADPARAELEALASDPRAPRTWRDRTDEALADDDLARGLGARAADEYRTVAARSLDEDAVRTLEVKALAAEDPVARRAILDLLVAEPGRVLDSWIGALSLGAWAADPGGPLATYLVGKNLTTHAAGQPREAWDRAAAWLDRALAAGPPTPAIGRELLRQRAVAACVLVDEGARARVEADVVAEASPFANTSGGRRAWILRLLRRCGAPRD